MTFLHRHFPQKIVSGFPIRAILTLTVTGKLQTDSKPCNPGAPLKALAPSSLFQLAGAGQNTLRLIAQLVKQIPCYALELETDRAGILSAISSLATAS